MKRLMIVLALAACLLPAMALANERAKGFLGVGLEAEALADGTESVVVGKVYPGTPAETAGLQPGDVFVEFAGERPTSREHLAGMCTSRAPGTTVSLTIRRGAEEQQLKVMLGLRPEAAELQKTALIGQPAPPLSVVPFAGGDPITLASLAGKVVVIDFWASWCGPCRAAIPDLNALASARAGADFVLLGITDETPEVAGRVADSMKYAVAHDVDSAVNAAYAVFALPTLVVIDQAGVVRHVRIGGGSLRDVESLIDELLAAG